MANAIGTVEAITLNASRNNGTAKGFAATVSLPTGEKVTAWFSAEVLWALMPLPLTKTAGKCSDAFATLFLKDSVVALEHREAGEQYDEDDSNAVTTNEHYSIVLKGSTPINNDAATIALDIVYEAMKGLPIAKRDDVSLMQLTTANKELISDAAELYEVQKSHIARAISELLGGFYNSKVVVTEVATKEQRSAKTGSGSGATGDSELVTAIKLAKKNAAGDITLTASLDNVLIGLRNGTLTASKAQEEFEKIVADAHDADVDLTKPVTVSL